MELDPWPGTSPENMEDHFSLRVFSASVGLEKSRGLFVGAVLVYHTTGIPGSDTQGLGPGDEGSAFLVVLNVRTNGHGRGMCCHEFQSTQREPFLLRVPGQLSVLVRLHFQGPDPPVMS